MGTRCNLCHLDHVWITYFEYYHGKSKYIWHVCVVLRAGICCEAAWADKQHPNRLLSGSSDRSSRAKYLEQWPPNDVVAVKSMWYIKIKYSLSGIFPPVIRYLMLDSLTRHLFLYDFCACSFPPENPPVLYGPPPSPSLLKLLKVSSYFLFLCLIHCVCQQVRLSAPHASTLYFKLSLFNAHPVIILEIMWTLLLSNLPFPTAFPTPFEIHPNLWITRRRTRADAHSCKAIFYERQLRVRVKLSGDLKKEDPGHGRIEGDGLSKARD